MEICKVDLTSQISKESYIALGNFDGVHLGHKVLIDTVVSKAKKKNSLSSVLIFTVHTKNVTQGKKQELLTSMRQKYDILEDLGIDLIYEMEFNENIMRLSPEEFVLSFLKESLKVEGIVVGYDYRFGYKAQGNIELLEKLCHEKLIDLEIIKAVYDGDEAISSTRIRHLIKEGKVQEAKELLGRPFRIDGKVIKGKGLGRTLGIPTANLSLNDSFVIPKYGVYSGKVKVDNREYVSAINIGVNPTFGEAAKLEAYLLDFQGDLYGKDVRVQLDSYIRPEMKFDSINGLKEQMEKDIKNIRNMHSN